MTKYDIIYTVLFKAYNIGDYEKPTAMDMLLIALEMIEDNRF